MFRVNEMMGNFSKEVAMFSEESEAQEYLLNRLLDERDEQGGDTDEENEELFYSHFSIDDDMREWISIEQISEMYNDMLDECYPEMFNMCASIILERADPIQYNCGLNDFYDSICDQYYCEEME